MKTCPITALASTFLLFYVVSARGIDMPPPDTLPISGPAAFRSAIVTNQMIFYNSVIHYRNTSGQLTGASLSGGKTFTSLQEYEDYISSTSTELFGQHKDLMTPTDPIIFESVARYYTPDMPDTQYPVVLKFGANIGTVSTVTSNSFKGLPAQIELAYIHIPGLQEFVIEVPDVYTNSWPADPNRPEQYPPVRYGITVFPPELTTSNWLVLNPWYSMGTNEVTITVKSAGVTKRYSSSVTTPSEWITILFTPGMKVNIESSLDLVTWNALTNFTDFGYTGKVRFPILKNLPQQFFKTQLLPPDA